MDEKYGNPKKRQTETGQTTEEKLKLVIATMGEGAKKRLLLTAYRFKAEEDESDEDNVAPDAEEDQTTDTDLD